MNIIIVVLAFIALIPVSFLQVMLTEHFQKRSERKKRSEDARFDIDPFGPEWE